MPLLPDGHRIPDPQPWRMRARLADLELSLLWCTGSDPLRLLCCCAPGYSDADTVMLE